MRALILSLSILSKNGLFPNEESAHQFFKTVNSIHESIKFTSEQELNGKLAFLGVLLMRDSKDIVQTSVYGKPTRIGLYNKFNSFVPKRYKRNLVMSLLHRTYNIGFSYKTIPKEFQKKNQKMLAKKRLPRLIYRQLHKRSIKQKAYRNQNNGEKNKKH